MRPKIKVVVADDHPIFRRGLINLVNSEENLEVIGEAENGLQTLDLVKSLKPDILILDIKMPFLDGVGVAKTVFEKFPNVKIILLSFEIDADQLENLKRFQIRGYLLKESVGEEIVKCINQVAARRMYMSPEILDLFMQTVEKISHKTEKKSLISTLTPTEIRILGLLAQAKTNKEIAEKLSISEHTCAKHRSNMCFKLKLSGNHSLLKFAIENKELIQQS